MTWVTANQVYLPIIIFKISAAYLLILKTLRNNKRLVPSLLTLICCFYYCLSFLVKAALLPFSYLPISGSPVTLKEPDHRNEITRQFKQTPDLCVLNAHHASPNLLILFLDRSR